MDFALARTRSPVGQSANDRGSLAFCWRRLASGPSAARIRLQPQVGNVDRVPAVGVGAKNVGAERQPPPSPALHILAAFSELPIPRVAGRTLRRPRRN